MQATGSRWLIRVALSLCLAGWLWLVFFQGLAARDLWNSHEARAGMDAQSLLDQGDWLLPRLYDGRLELQKPPLYYWLVAGIAQLRGGLVDAWAIRLPSTLAALICLLALVWLGHATGRLRAGMLAALILATAVHFTWLARVGRIDMPLTATTTCALLGFYLGLKIHRGYFLLAYLSLALAVLLKGPIGLVLPAAALFCFLLAEKELPAPWQLRSWWHLAHRLALWWGLPLLLALTVPWFWLAERETGGELSRVFLWHHNVERGLGGSRLRGHPIWFYGPQLAIDFLPWSLLVPGLLYGLRRSLWSVDREIRLGLCWFVGMTLVLSLARYKRADYLVPAYPGLALFVAIRLTQCCTPRRLLQGVAVVLLLSALGWSVRVGYLLPQVEPQRQHQQFAQRIREQIEGQQIVFFRTEAHALAFHLRTPILSLVHWDELERLPCRTQVIMPRAVAQEARTLLQERVLQEIACNDPAPGQRHEKPLVLVRVQGKSTSSRASPPPGP